MHDTGEDAKSFAEKVLSEAYDYDNGTVCFSPTLTYGKDTFRGTKEGALSYFVGGNPNFPTDKGFALKPWVKAHYDNGTIQIHGYIAIAQQNFHFIAKDGSKVMVDKTFGYRKGEDGKLRIILHHSSLQYNPNP